MKPHISKRRNFTTSVKSQIKSRSNEICEICYCRVATDYHHIMPKSRSGRGVYTNGLHLCRTCHRGLHDNMTLLNKEIEKATQKYGVNFYKDKWDKV